MKRKVEPLVVLILIATGVWIAGLIVALVGLLLDDDLETKAALILFITGMSIFALGIVVTCLISCLERRRVRAIRMSLPEDVVGLYSDVLAHFTNEGLAIARLNEPIEGTDRIPYTHVRVYRERIYTSPRSKGWVTVVLQLPSSALCSVSEEDEGDVTMAFPVDEKTISLAQEYGVQVVDRTQAPAKERKRIAKIVARVPGYRTKVAAWLAVEIALVTAFILLGVFAWNSAGWASAFASAVVVLASFQIYGLLDGDRLHIYSNGIYIRTSGLENEARRFLPTGQIERISRTVLGIRISTDGVADFYFPDGNGAWETLLASFPEKCTE